MNNAKGLMSHIGWQLLILGGFLAIWQWAYALHAQVPAIIPDLFDPYFISKPSQVIDQFLVLSCLKSPMGIWSLPGSDGFARCMVKFDNNLWYATWVTLRNTFLGFVTGVSSGYVLGLLLGRSEKLADIFQPSITAINSIPRIALAPIIVLAFGIGDSSKIVTSWICVVFLVFYNVFAGARSVDAGFINAARLLGASEWQITRTVIIPSTMAWLFACLTPSVSFALIGVIVGEFIGSEHGIGRLIIESEARGEAAGMMVAVVVLMIIGVILSAVIWRLQAYLLRWQSQPGRGPA